MGNVDSGKIRKARAAIGAGKIASPGYRVRNDRHRIAPLQGTTHANIRSNVAQVRAATTQGTRPVAWQWSVPCVMTGTSLLTGAICAILFGVDLLMGWPFHRASLFLDAVFSFNGLILLVLGRCVYQELPKIARNNPGADWELLRRAALRGDERVSPGRA